VPCQQHVEVGQDEQGEQPGGGRGGLARRRQSGGGRAAGSEADEQQREQRGDERPGRQGRQHVGGAAVDEQRHEPDQLAQGLRADDQGQRAEALAALQDAHRPGQDRQRQQSGGDPQGAGDADVQERRSDR
jgi:hypothetical protein